MHGSVMNYLRKVISSSEVQGKDILEVGSHNFNGSAREIIAPMNPKSYIGIDQGHGPCVDMVINAGDVAKVFGNDRFDIVVSTEMLEHAEDWKSAVIAMKSAVKPNGLLILTARGPGMPYHGFPHDHWRFTVEDARRIFSDLEILDLQPDTDHPGILMKARKGTSFIQTDLSVISVAPAPNP